MMAIRRCSTWIESPKSRRAAGTYARTKYLVRSSRQPERDGGRDRHDLLMFGLDQLPAALMHHPMVPATEQDQVVEVGRTAVDPMHEMMSIAHRGRALQPGHLQFPSRAFKARPRAPQ